MKVYIYQAALVCEACGDQLCAHLPKPAGMVPIDEASWDSNDYPKGPYPDGGGEADCAQHCDKCGVALDNPVIGDGGF